MKVKVTISADGSEFNAEAIDLAGDAWSDYSHHLQVAAQAEASDQVHQKNRSLRAASISLAAHFEGVVGKVCARLAAPKNNLPKLNLARRDRSLRAKLDALEEHARCHMSTPLPALQMRFKLFRDIIAHPGISKMDRETDPKKPEKLSEIEVYDLCVDEVRSQGVAIEEWLDSVCVTYRIDRVEDTEGIVRKLAEALGGVSEPPKRM